MNKIILLPLPVRRQGIFFYYKYENIFIILQTCTFESAIIETKQIVKEKKKLQRTYISIDLKSFYASVECRERGLDPLDTNLVVADERRTDKTICLAVTPSLKSYGIPGRGRLFEVKQRVQQINAARRFAAPGRQLCGSSCSYAQLQSEPQLALDFIIAPPRMAYYMEYSTRIYEIYLRYVAPEDIIVYSVDEVFMDVTQYFELYGLSARELAMRIILDVLRETGITATAGIGTNLFLAKVAMDVRAKHIAADANGVRIAELDEQSYRRELWQHRPLTDFWRVGRGYASKLEARGIYTMGDIARCSVYNEELLYRLFGKNAELLIDHAWGWEPCTIADVKGYRPQVCSLSSGQVLHRAYESAEALLVLREMADALALELVSKALVTDQIVLTVGYDIDNLKQGSSYQGVVKIDCYGRRVPQHAHGSFNLGCFSSSSKLLVQAAADLYERITDSNLLVRRLTLAANHVLPAQAAAKKQEQELSLFNFGNEAVQQAAWQRENRLQQAQLEIKRRFGKNSVLKGMSLLDGATAKERNEQIGGHKA